MSDLSEQPGIISRKTRRRHSRAFKEQVLAECRESGESVAAVARRYDLNDNLVHNWRRTLGDDGTPGFVRLPSPVAQPVTETTAVPKNTLVRIEVPSSKGAIVAHWPMSEIDRSVPWLRALMR